MKSGFQEALDAKVAAKQKRADELKEQAKKPTPGPWFTMDLGKRGFDVYTKGPHGPFPIAQNLTEGDARLMATSPHLLLLAHAYVELAEQLKEHFGGSGVPAMPALDDCIAHAKRLIATAEGSAA